MKWIQSLSRRKKNVHIFLIEIAALSNSYDVMSVGELLPSIQLEDFPLFDPLQTRIIDKDDMA